MPGEEKFNPSFSDHLSEDDRKKLENIAKSSQSDSSESEKRKSTPKPRRYTAPSGFDKSKTEALPAAKPDKPERPQAASQEHDEDDDLYLDFDDELDETEDGEAIDDEPELIGKPTGAKSTKEIEEELSADKTKDPAERIKALEEQLALQRDALARMGAKKSKRAFSRKRGLSKYAGLHGMYNKTLQQLTIEKLNYETEYKDLDDKSKVAQGLMFMSKMQTELREETTKLMRGTKVGMIVEWLNKGGRLARIAKLGAVGVVAAGAGALTGGVLGAAAAGVTAAGFRAFRGYAIGEGKSGGFKLQEYDDSELKKIADASSNLKEFLSKGASELVDSYNTAISERQKRFWRAVGRGALYASLGAGVGYAVNAAADHLSTTSNGGVTVVPPEADSPAPELPDSNLPPIEHDFTYHPHENPFYAPGKIGIHDMGPALDGDPQMMGKPGLHDLTQNRWVNSPEQFASVVSAMGLDHLPDNMQTAEALAEEFKINPGLMADTHERVMEILHDPATKIETGVPIENPYSSEYGVDAGNGDVRLAWDDYVDHGGTKTVITFKNPTTGLMETLELRENCGGQRIEEHPAPAPAPEPVYKPPTTYEAPQATYNPPVVHEQPPQAPPPPQTPRPEVPPPPPPPPPPLPPVIPPIEPPVGPDKLETHNPMPRMDPPFQGGRPDEPVVPNIPESKPPEVYIPPILGGNDNSPAPGSFIPDIGSIFDQGQSAQSGLNPGGIDMPNNNNSKVGRYR